MSEEKMRDSQWQQAGWIASWLTRHAINLETGPFVELQDHLAALQESEAGAVYECPKCGAEMEISMTATPSSGYFLIAPQSAQAIETATLMRAMKVVDGWASTASEYGFDGDMEQFMRVKADIEALITQDGRTQLEQKCMEVAEDVADLISDGGYQTDDDLRAIVTNLIGEKK